MKKLAFPLVLIAIAAALVGLFALGGGAKKADEQNPVERIGQKVDLMPQSDHVADGTDVQYSTNPGTSGQHYGQPAKERAENVKDEVAIHNLEHGYIWVTYRACGDQITDKCLSQQQVADLKKAANELPGDPLFNVTKWVMTERPENDHPISLAAWGYLLHMDAPDADQIRKFYDGNVNQAPEKLP